MPPRFTISGELAVSDPYDGCTQWDDPSALKGKIAVIDGSKLYLTQSNEY
jgi:hypothetical protein